MPVPQISLISSNATLKDVIDALARMQKEFQYMTNQGIDTANMLEVGGWIVQPNILQSVDGDVGMSTEDTGADDVRFFAGPNGDVWSFYVTKSGKLTATGALIRSVASGYPRLELNGTDGLFAAYHTETDYIAIDPDATGNATLIFENGLTTVLVSAIGATYAINAILGNISINAQSGDLFLSAGGGANKVRFVSWADIKNDDTGQTLQQALDAISSSIPSGSYAVITYSGGIATSGRALLASDIPSGISPSKIATDASNRFVTDTEKSTWNNKTQSGRADVTLSASYFGSVTITFSTAFAVAPVVTANTNGLDYYCSCDAATTTSVTIYVVHRDGTPVTATVNIGWIAT